MRRIFAIGVAFLLLALVNTVHAKLPSKSDLIHHHSSLTRGITRRASRCNSGKTVATSALFANSTISSNWLCHGIPSEAITTVTKISGPNGSQSWLNCGIDGPGWTPPPVTVDQIVAVDLQTALKDPASPFHVCSAYLQFFEKYGKLNGLPPILLASFSLQESGCNPATVGGAGEQGLMQITKEKCVGAPRDDCLDPEFNIKTAARYFAETLAEDNGNIILSVGRYNGWRPGLTVKSATAAAHTDCCRCQNNLDYLVQFFDGWVLNLNPYKLKTGSYFNLNVCPKDT